MTHRSLNRTTMRTEKRSGRDKVRQTLAADIGQDGGQLQAEHQKDSAFKMKSSVFQTAEPSIVACNEKNPELRRPM